VASLPETVAAAIASGRATTGSSCALPASRNAILPHPLRYERLNLTGFVMRAVLPAAQEIVAWHERSVLAASDGVRVLDLLEHPPALGAALRAAETRRRKRV
jgi:uncharacterized protein (DUF1778 family)